MSREEEGNGRELERSVARYKSRRQAAARQGSLARDLAAAGSLGWLVVVPTLLGIALGRWLDVRLDAGVTYTAAGLVLGASFGTWLLVRGATHGRGGGGAP